MATSLTTFERDLRRRLLDVIYSQWRDLGAPFSASPALQSAREVIDPEALLWGSLEFLPTEPRLCEAVVSWLDAHRSLVIRQRLKRRINQDEPRAQIWQVLEGESSEHSPSPSLKDEPCHGLESAAELARFTQRLTRDLRRRGRSTESRLGRRADGPSTILLRARELLGSEVRHLLLIYLLGRADGGGRLRTANEWSGYSYRSVSETAGRWESAQAATIEHGYCRLTDAESWKALLRHGEARLVVVNWLELFDACVALLRALAKARRKHIPHDGPVIAAHRRDVRSVLESSVLSDTREHAHSVAYLDALFSEDGETRATA